MFDTDRAPAFRIAIGIATRGRAGVLASTLQRIAVQTRVPDRIVVCGTSRDDIGEIPPGVEFILSRPGLPLQRNRIIDTVPDCDAVLFLDDDFLISERYVEATARVLVEHHDIVATTGFTIADGAREAGYSVADGLRLIAEDAGADLNAYIAAPHGYGCNMAIRLSTARAHDIRFDERLPLYAWSEDVDYTHRIGRYGQIVKLIGARGVHLGVKHGRSSGKRLGYSQVANPIYLYLKGSYSFGRAARSVGRNVAMNVAKSVWSEPFIDRRGRLGGNCLALLDIVTGRLAPERVLDL
jgi:hypothetical protein